MFFFLFLSIISNSDNITLIQEVIRTLKNRRGGTGYVALKLDLEKAYDWLDWAFIRESLEFFRLPPNFSPSLRIWYPLPASIYFGMAVPYRKLCLLGELGKETCCPPIFLSCVWNVCLSAWKRLSTISYYTLCLFGGESASPICSLQMTFFCSPKPRLETAGS